MIRPTKLQVYIKQFRSAFLLLGLGIALLVLIGFLLSIKSYPQVTNDNSSPLPLNNQSTPLPSQVAIQATKNLTQVPRQGDNFVGFSVENGYKQVSSASAGFLQYEKTENDVTNIIKVEARPNPEKLVHADFAKELTKNQRGQILASEDFVERDYQSYRYYYLNYNKTRLISQTLIAVPKHTSASNPPAQYHIITVTESVDPEIPAADLQKVQDHLKQISSEFLSTYRLEYSQYNDTSVVY